MGAIFRINGRLDADRRKVGDEMHRAFRIWGVEFL